MRSVLGTSFMFDINSAQNMEYPFLKTHTHTHTLVRTAGLERGSLASLETHGGGLSGRPSDLSFRCLSALVRVDFTMSSWVMFNSGCCWMYSRITSCSTTKTSLSGGNVDPFCRPPRPLVCSYLVQLPLLQRLADPFQPLLVRQLCPLFAQIVLDVFGGGLMSARERQH